MDENGKVTRHARVADGIRAAEPQDVPAILALVKELAEFEHLSHQVSATEADYHSALFSEAPDAEALVAVIEGEIIGYAIFFPTFSTFLGRAGIWLEDLYVSPSHRGNGWGKALLKAVGAIARQRGAGRMEWSVLDWNQRAIDLYQQIGGEILSDWRIVRLDHEGLEHLESK